MPKEDETSDEDEKEEDDDQQNGPLKNEINLPIQEIVTMIGKGGAFRNENGLIYDLHFKGE